ncbi:hypothetical protein ABZS83_33045 [Streptomyces sp. NPDC005426]|uniref:hypothetical protein n=1 Tax=Streptomyces sp. NPDC005426 TaxID=3155344 RepID=UPI0033B78940
MARITTPVPGYSGQGPGNLQFQDGVAESDDPAILDYCRSAGYGIDGEPPERTAPEPPDPRKVGEVGAAPLRDAAVDPRPSDYRAPTNAGEANPHGPLVVSPGITDGAPPAALADAEVNEAHDGPEEPRPPQSAPVADWRAYALTQVDNDPAVHAEVEKLTKAELIKQYGG